MANQMEESKMTVYIGPNASFATITGSPFWGRSIEQVRDEWISGGWKHLETFQPETPYGDGPTTLHFVTRNGRSVLWIPSYGMKAGRDWKYDRSDQKLFWILWKAGVKVLLVGGTSGVAEWRDGEDRIEPGDVVLPTDFFTSRDHRGLLGTPYETAWPRHDLTLDDPFCSELSNVLEVHAREYEGRGIRRVHTPRNARVALVVPPGITYETTFDIETWQAQCKLISEMKPSLPPRVTLHGDCINPVLARLLGIHEVYYHMVANWAQGVNPNVRITETLYPLYLSKFPEVAMEMEFQLLEEMPVPTGLNCNCISGLEIAPEIFSEAMDKE